jgi:hypothetical protein
MTNDNFERLNVLDNKVLSGTASDDELKEFNQLLKLWNESAEQNLFSDDHLIQALSKHQ